MHVVIDADVAQINCIPLSTGKVDLVAAMVTVRPELEKLVLPSLSQLPEPT